MDDKAEKNTESRYKLDLEGITGQYRFGNQFVQSFGGPDLERTFRSCHSLTHAHTRVGISNHLTS